MRALFVSHGAEFTPEGRSLRLLREWLLPAQREQFGRRGYFEVVGGDSGKHYRIHAGASVNVCEVDERGRLQEGFVFHADRHSADRRRHARPEDGAGNMRRRSTRPGQEVHSIFGRQETPE
jgi:hypothetical protein